MSVLERMAALSEPIGANWDDEWSWVASLQAVTWRQRQIRFKGVMRERFRVAMRGWSLRHMYRAMQRDVVQALKLCTPEMEWLRRVPTREIKPSGREMRWGAG